MELPRQAEDSTAAENSQREISACLLVVLRIGRVVDRRPYNGAEIARFEPFYAENDHFTKTGSGQRCKRLPRKTVSAEVLWVEALLQYYGASFPLWFVAFYRDIDR